MRRSARWAVPVAVAAAAAGTALAVPAAAGAAPDLPPATAAQLLADVAAAPPRALSGTVQQTSDLGLPQLPTSTGSGAGGPDGALAALLGGTTTARVWTDGAQRSRVAVIGRLSETDVVRAGRDVWTWRSGSSAERSAEHAVLPQAPAGEVPDSPALTPAQAAQRALAAVDPTTTTSLAGTARVAGRDARLLVLAPRQAGSLVGRVEIAVDAQTSTPLRVQVMARGATSPALSVGFTDVDFSAPSASELDPGVPAGVPVREVAAPQVRAHGTDGTGGPDRAGGAQRPTVIGQGWTAVVVARGASGAAATLGGLGAGTSGSGGSATAQALAAAAAPASGPWGSGRLLRTSLLSVLVLDDGRVLAGAVPPAALEAAAQQTAAG